MWNMQSGERVLTAAEWEVFTLGLGMLQDFVQPEVDRRDEAFSTGRRSFEGLSAEQRLVLLADVASALRDPDVPPPDLAAYNEAAVAAVLDHVEVLLDLELSDPDRDEPVAVRRRLRSMELEDPDRENPQPPETSQDREDWLELLKLFRMAIFWDEDFEDDDYLDLPAEAAAASLEKMGIDRDYYFASPEEPTELQVIQARQVLARMLGLPVPGKNGLYWAFQDLYHGLVVGPCTAAVLEEWGIRSGEALRGAARASGNPYTPRSTPGGGAVPRIDAPRPEPTAISLYQPTQLPATVGDRSHRLLE